MRGAFGSPKAVEIVEVAGNSDSPRVGRGMGFRLAVGYILV